MQPRSRRGGRPGLFQQAQRSTLAGQLVEPSRPLGAPRPQQGVVGTPHALPGLMPFGPAAPGFEQSSRFTGGAVEHPLSLTHGEDIPQFQQPDFAAPGVAGQAKGISPLLAALSGPSSLAPAATGATASGTGSGRGAFGGGAPAPTPAPSSGGLFPSPPSGPTFGGGAPPAGLIRPGADSSSTLSQLIAAIAQHGQKINPSRQATTFQMNRNE